MPDGPVKYPVTKDNPNYLFCNFPWFGLVSIRINKNQRNNGPVNAHLISWPTLVKHKHIKPEKYMVKK